MPSGTPQVHAQERAFRRWISLVDFHHRLLGILNRGTTLARKTLALLSALIFSTLALSAFALAEGTRTWEQSKFEELTKGTAKGIALRGEGGLELAPAFKALATTPSTYIWSIASDSAGNIYAAAGSPARVYRITPDGQGAAIFEPQELQVQALVVDKSG